MDILDMILGAEMANEYTDSQRLAHEEKTVITWDGNTEGKETIENEMLHYLYKISDEGIDVENIKSLMIYESGFNKASECIARTSVVHEGSLHMLIYDENAPAVLSTKEDFSVEGLEVKKGTYLYCVTDPYLFFVESITIETVHQIDPKFIPGLIPVLNLTTGFDLSGIGLECTAEENAVIQMAADNKMPILVQFSVQGVYVSALFAFSYAEGMSSFDAIAAEMTFSINNVTGVWQTLMSGRSE